MKERDLIIGEVVDFSHEGRPVIKKDSRVIFSDKGVIGDEVKLEITKVKKNFAEAKTLEIIKPSDHRVSLDKTIEESMGGIPLINYSYPMQLKWKEDKVKKDLEKFTGIKDVKVKRIISMDNPFNYRNNVQIPVRSFNGKNYIGFYQLASKNIVDMEATILQSKEANLVYKSIRSWIKRNEILGYNRRNRVGNLKHIGLRSNYKGEIMVILVTHKRKIDHISDLINDLKEKGVISIYQNIQTMDNSEVFGSEYIKLFGEDRLKDKIGEYEFELSPNSFFQVNRKQIENLYQIAISYLDLKESDVVYDLYSGIGTISIVASKYVNRVYGIEFVEEAVVDANENLKLNNIQNVEFMCARVEELLEKLHQEVEKPSKLILDPPRGGCQEEVLNEILKLNLERLVYISCNPTTLARDLKILINGGYRIIEVQPVDMFPHTAHVESIILMTYCGLGEKNRD